MQNLDVSYCIEGFDGQYWIPLAKGSSVSRLTAKIAGGAQMFATSSAVFNIGDRNVQAVKTVLSTYKIPIIAEQTGSNFGRTVFFHSDTGIMEIRAAVKPTVML